MDIIKSMLLLFASVLFVTTKVSSNYYVPRDHELKIKDQSERHSLLTVWLYPRIPYKTPGFIAPDLPSSPPPVTVVMPLTGNAQAPPPSSTPQVKTSKDCFVLCDKRCKTQTNKKICRRSCMACCDRCKCVPPGDYGTNMDKCGKCYTDFTYHEYKCP